MNVRRVCLTLAGLAVLALSSGCENLDKKSADTSEAPLLRPMSGRTGTPNASDPRNL